MTIKKDLALKKKHSCGKKRKTLGITHSHRPQEKAEELALGDQIIKCTQVKRKNEIVWLNNWNLEKHLTERLEQSIELGTQEISKKPGPLSPTMRPERDIPKKHDRTVGKKKGWPLN